MGTITGYHAHEYFERDTADKARALQEKLRDRFGGAVAFGRWNDRAVGPHKGWSYEVAFAGADFGSIVPWLLVNREGLVVFVHPMTGDDMLDHTAHAMWLGQSVDLELEIFSGS